MNDFFIVLIGVLCLFGLIALGFMVNPRPFRAHPAPSRPGSPVPFAGDLPEVVRKHFVETIGEHPQTIDSAVVWGRGKIYLRGMWLPMRFKTWYRPGEAFARRLEITWFQRPVFRVWMSWKSKADEQAASDENLHHDERDISGAFSLWSEAIWMPAVFVHQKQVQWQAVDTQQAKFSFSVKQNDEQIETMEVQFDPISGRIISMSACRPIVEEISFDPGPFDSPVEARPDENQSMPWRVDLSDWKRFGDFLLPEELVVAEGDSGAPTSYWNIDGVVYNVDVSDQLG